jgi:hypothetical protein
MLRCPHSVMPRPRQRALAPTVGVGEGATRKRGDYDLPTYGGMLDRLYIPV